ncbi:MAG: hypothetical protein J0L67_04135 [Cytophagales bacterium]|nr:hypothetical protein [Cytophagales bacterium]
MFTLNKILFKKSSTSYFKKLTTGLNILVVLASCCLLSSCLLNVEEPDVPEVYVAGYERSTTAQTEDQATLWKNGSAIRLTDGTRQARAYAVTVSAGDVYVAGFERNGSNTPVAKYWKNGTAVSLTNGAWSSWATGIAIAGADVYVSGYTTGFGSNVALVWKNGTAQELTDGTHEARVESMYVSETAVYVAGWEYNSSVPVAKYWKNGNEVLLSDGVVPSMAQSVVVSGEDVYVSGSENGVATVWKNGTAQRIGTTGRSTVAFALALANNDIHAVGGDRTDFDIPHYWKNGVQTTLPTSYPSVVRSIFLVDNKIYAAGGGWAGGGRSSAQIWENGTSVRLTGGSQDADAYSIYVTR